MTTNASVLTVSDDSPFVDRVAEKVRTLAAVKPARVRLLEWQIDEELARAIHSDHGSRHDLLSFGRIGFFLFFQDPSRLRRRPDIGSSRDSRCRFRGRSGRVSCRDCIFDNVACPPSHQKR
jgi:hypothetical protein